MNFLTQIAGTAIVILALLDVFFTVLFPASGHGPVRKPLSWAVWCIFRVIGTITAGERRRNFLSYSGPVLFAVTSTVWFVLLVIGWAMIYKPALGTAITASSGTTDTSWAMAIYYSGFNLTTLGVGDVTANTGLYRLLTITEAAAGFAFFSLVITYFLSVYSEITSRNAFAQGLHHLTGKTGNAAELLARLADDPDLSTVKQHLSSKADFLRQMYQTNRFYPVLRYFHYREPCYALPRILLIALDTATLLRSGLDKDRYARLMHSPSLDDLFESAMCLIQELSGNAPQRKSPPAALEAWRKHYHATAARLSQVGVAVRSDLDAGASEYIAARIQWDPSIHVLAEIMLYEWESIEQPPAPKPGSDRARGVWSGRD